MYILSIETSCDETAVSLVRADGEFPEAAYTILGNGLFSQIDIHKEFGGVFPNVAKREHAKALVPMLEKALREADILIEIPAAITEADKEHVRKLLVREEGLADSIFDFFSKYSFSAIDRIAVTSGPGLEPALWVGVNFAQALGYLRNTPVIPVNHMKGHIFASLLKGNILEQVTFPAVALLISGGHTDLVRMNDYTSFEVIGSTRDDAVGEAFDKTARMLGLPYPGGPQIGSLAGEAREQNLPQILPPLPRPMLTSGDLDFSFSGLKTAVRTRVLDVQITNEEKKQYAREIEDAITDVLIRKVHDAIDRTGAQTLIVGGGVSANTHIRKSLERLVSEDIPYVKLHMPERNLSTDNSIMIALAAHAEPNIATSMIVAQGSLQL